MNLLKHFQMFILSFLNVKTFLNSVKDPWFTLLKHQELI